MTCPESQIDCDNPGCRHGGCQGRLPELPLFRGVAPAVRQGRALKGGNARVNREEEDAEPIAA
jgi:hypothetical protein